MNDDHLRMLPHDIEHEQCVLGAMMLSPAAAAHALAELGTLDFYRPAHQEIFDAASRLVQRGEPLDVQTLRAELERSGKTKQAGGAIYLVELSAIVPTASNARYYVGHVQELGTKRAAIESVIRIGEMGYNASTSAEDLIAAVENTARRLRRLTDEGISELSTLGSFVDQPDSDYDWLIPGVLERMDRVIVVASEGAGKTTLARQVAVMLAAGVHPFAPATLIRPVRSLYVDLENPPSLVRRKARHLVDLGRRVEGWDDARCWRWTRPGGIDLRKPHDQHLLDRVIADSRAEFLAIGPLYKAFTASGDAAEQVNGQVSQVLDRMRERHGIALWLETHAPMEQNGQRSLRPLGSGVWSRWPEFGLALRKSKERPDQVFVERFRGDRDERAWPHRLQRSSPWPWAAVWDGGYPVEEATSA